HLIRRLFFHSRHNPVHLRVQRFLLRIESSQHTIQRFGRSRQPFRRRHQLLQCFLIHTLPPLSLPIPLPSPFAHSSPLLTLSPPLFIRTPSPTPSSYPLL